MARLRTVLRFSVWLLPASGVKNGLLRVLGHDVHPSARARPNLVWNVAVLRMGEGSRIGLLNVVKNLREVSIGPGASVGRLNVISSHPVFPQSSVTLGARSYITSHHHLDCSGGLSLGQLSALAGHDSRVMTHSIDLATNRQDAQMVIIGARSFIGARVLILGGAELPCRSVLAAGSVLTKSRSESVSGLWAGNPAVFKKPVDGAWFDRESMSTTSVTV